MAHEAIKQKIHALLKEGLFPGMDDSVDVSDGTAGDIHVVVVSRKFDGKRMKERNDMVWDDLERSLTPEEWGLVSLTATASPEEVKAIY